MKPDEEKTFDPNEKVEFTYPEGFEKAAAALTMFPDEETRKKMLWSIANIMLRQ